MSASSAQQQVFNYLAQSKAAAGSPQLKDFYTAFEGLYEKKLWHQLTVKLHDFAAVTQPSPPSLVSLYDGFVKDWEKKMNPLSLVQFVITASRQIQDPKVAMEFIQKHVDTFKENGKAQDAYVLASMETAHYKLRAGDYEGTKAIMDASGKILDKMDSVQNFVHASYYRVSAEYFKAKAVYPKFYHTALLFLSSVTLSDLPVEERQARAYELAIAALLGEGLYNFGDLLMHPILDSLKAPSPLAWLHSFLFAFNTGNISQFEQITASQDFIKNTFLSSAIAALRQKFCLMTLVQIVFSRSKADRARMTFVDIARETRVSADQVEHLVMKALSLGLIHGTIDQVEEVVSVTWVQPRVLDMGQMQSLATRLTGWADKVQTQVNMLESMDGGHEVFVQ